MLSQVLRELEHNGLIERKVFEVIPPKVEYKLTDEGQKLLPIMKLMANWGEKYEVL
jgi:DNA-binding HxlR family transcriptional regulator